MLWVKKREKYECSVTNIYIFERKKISFIPFSDEVTVWWYTIFTILQFYNDYNLMIYCIFICSSPLAPPRVLLAETFSESSTAGSIPWTWSATSSDAQVRINRYVHQWQVDTNAMSTNIRSTNAKQINSRSTNTNSTNCR